METVIIKVGYKGYAKVTYEDGTIIRISPDEWKDLQIARAKCRSDYGDAVEAVWYYGRIMELRAKKPVWKPLS